MSGPEFWFTLLTAGLLGWMAHSAWLKLRRTWMELDNWSHEPGPLCCSYHDPEGTERQLRLWNEKLGGWDDERP